VQVEVLVEEKTSDALRGDEGSGMHARVLAITYDVVASRG
jgi:hypothetical protein